MIFEFGLSYDYLLEFIQISIKFYSYLKTDDFYLDALYQLQVT